MHGGTYYQPVGHHHHHHSQQSAHHHHLAQHPLMYPTHHHSGYYAHSGTPSDSYSSYGDHVTVLQIDQNVSGIHQSSTNHQLHPMSLPSAVTKVPESDFVTVVQIASSEQPQPSQTQCQSSSQQQQQQQQQQPGVLSQHLSSSQRSIYVDAGQIEEEVTVYRLPGERLGMALRFDGGQTANESIRRVFVQSITANSPASKAIGLMLGILRDGDEILQIDGRQSNTLTRLECITMLRDAPVCIRLVVRRTKPIPGVNPDNYFKPIPTSYSTNNIPALINSSETPIMSQLLSQSSETLPRKVPPPVPPRLATTTLSIKRRPKSVCVLPTNQTEVEMTVQTNDNSAPGSVVGSNSTTVEKPPRRKHMNGPPPLPPRRPKCPPPKPPTERIAQIIITTTSSSVVSSADRCEQQYNAPIVTVISKKVTPEPLDSLARPLVSVVSISSPRTSPTNTMNNAAKSTPTIGADDSEPNVTFTITNSKVSSFIRQTAERLQRKLSGKFDNNDDEAECNSANNSNDNHNNDADALSIDCATDNLAPEVDEKKAEENGDFMGRNSISETPTEFESLTEDFNSCLESDTDDTASTVSTIIERKQSGKYAPNSQSCGGAVNTINSLHNDLSPAFSDLSSQSYVTRSSSLSRKMANIDDTTQIPASPTQPSPSSSSSSPTTSSSPSHYQHSPLQSGLVNSSQKNDNILQGQMSGSNSTSIMKNNMNSSSNITSDSNTNVSMQLSLNKTNELIKTEQLPVELKYETCHEQQQQQQHQQQQPPRNNQQSVLKNDHRSSASIQHKDTVPSMMTPITEPELTVNESTVEQSQVHDVEDVIVCKQEQTINYRQNIVTNNTLPEDDDEDMALVHKELMDRLDDDREDEFMLDTEYLAESTARFKHYHSGSELMLSSYCELTSIREEEEEDLESDKHPSIVIVSPIDSGDMLNKNSSDTDADSGIKSPDGSEGGSSNRSNSSQSSFNSDKMSLGNVFDFLNEANDDFEFVERMLELTNDKIDSLDDIMRIRESIKEIQMSNQRENLERFLDSNNVVDELIALSSPSTSSAHSTTSSIETESDSGESNCSTGIGKIKTTKIKKKSSSTLNIAQKPDVPLKPLQLTKSKIPVLDRSTSSSMLSLRSNSVNNISQQYNSLLELRPSLIPIAIPSNNHSNNNNNYNNNNKPTRGRLNRSTSMQTISTTFNSLPRPVKANKYIPNHRRSSLNLSTTSMTMSATAATGPTKSPGTNAADSPSSVSSPNYGSLSRQVSKSTTNVFTTGSLPRPIKQQKPLSSPGMNTTTRTSSMVDLTNRKGFVASTSCTALPPLHCKKNYFQQSKSTSLPQVSPQQQQQQQQPSPSSLFCSSSSTSFSASFSVSSPSSSSSLCYTLKSTVQQTDTGSCEDRLGIGKCSPSQSKSASTSNLLLTTFTVPESNHCTDLSNKTLSKSSNSLHSLTSSSTVSASYSAVSSFWSSFEKQNCSNSSKILRPPVARKILKSNVNNLTKSFTSPTTPTSSSPAALTTSTTTITSSQSLPESNTMITPTTPTTPTRSILRCPSLRFKNDPFECRLSDSESSNSSSDEQNDNHWKKTQRRPSLKVCFLDEVLERDFIASPVDESDEMEHQSEDEQCLSPAKEMPHYELSVLSSAASISSISSLSSSTDSCSSTSISSLKPLSNIRNAPIPRREADSGLCVSDISSEFSQSPSPDFEKMNRCSIKERIAFFDASMPTSKTMQTRTTSITGFAKNGITPLLSRSCSAPYDSEFGGMQSTDRSSSTMITNGAATKVRIEPKSPGTLSKLKGLIIPYLPDAETSPKHQLPIIKSEQLYRVPIHTDSTVAQSPASIHHETDSPVAYPPPLRPANITVAKYSPMFKRRELTLPPVADYPVVGRQQSTSIKFPPTVPPKPKTPCIELEQTPLIEAPIVAHVQPSKHHQDDGPTIAKCPTPPPPTTQILCENQVKPVDHFELDNEHLPQIDAVTNECQSTGEESIVESTASSTVQVHREDHQDDADVVAADKASENAKNNCEDETQNDDAENDCNDCDDNPSHNVEQNNGVEIVESSECMNNSKSNTVQDIKENGDKNGEESCDFIIYQRQYSMRAVMLDDVTPSNLGLTLCGGLNAKRKEVTINQIATGSVAERDARLQIGDRIVSINGKSVMAMMHDETVDLLEQAAESGKVLLIVSRPLEGNERSSRESSPTTTPLVSDAITNVTFIQTDVEQKKSPYSSLEHNPGSCRLVTAQIMKDFNGLGFIIEGGYSPLGDRPITIKRIFRGGPVDKEGSLVEGDELQSINDQSIAGMSRAEVWSHLKQLPDGKVQLTVRRVKRYL